MESRSYGSWRIWSWWFLNLISFNVIGDGVYGKLNNESGSHRVQRVPKTETQGRVHTSTATVLVMPEMEEVDVQINKVI